MVCVMAGSLAECNSVKAEVMVCLKELREAKARRLVGVFMEGDSSTVVSWEKDEAGGP